MIALSVAKLKMVSSESEMFLWIKPKKEKLFCVESLDQCRRLEVREKERISFVMSLLLSDHKVLHNIASSSSFFRFRFFRSYFVLQIFGVKEFNKCEEMRRPLRLRCNHRQTSRPRNRPRDRTTNFTEGRNRQNSIHPYLPSTKPCNQKCHSQKLQNSSQWPRNQISFKRDKHLGNFLVRSAFKFTVRRALPWPLNKHFYK